MATAVRLAVVYREVFIGRVMYLRGLTAVLPPEEEPPPLPPTTVAQSPRT